jgi:hypothetical protein
MFGALRREGQGAAAALLGALATAAAPAGAQDKNNDRWMAGAYAFSDELGGFTIKSVSGTGTREDPIVLREELVSSTPVTLTIRTTRQIQAFDMSGNFANGILYMRVEARNASGQGWVEFEFELQETLRKPSTFGDGLSFDQRSAMKDTISSASFIEFSRDFEPYDKLLFRDGRVDPGGTAGFSFLITDFTPRWEFFLVQDPRIPST